MKKYSIIALSLLSVLLIFNSARANDSGDVPVFWIKDNRIHCVSVINPEDMEKNSFLLFDYSPKVGEKLGRPWAIVEKGKCYETDENGGVLYQVHIKTGKERQQLSNYSKYKPTDEITAFDYNIERLWPYGPFEVPVPARPGLDMRFTGIVANEVFPTKYDFGHGITYFSLFFSEEMVGRVMKDPSFIEIQKLYSNLAEQLQNTIKSCDSRVRIEHQLEVVNEIFDKSGVLRSTIDEKDVIWKMASGEDIKFSSLEEFNSLKAIEVLGCKAAFSEFIHSHQTDFNRVDQLAEELINKYPNEISQHFEDQEIEDLEGYDLIFQRDPNLIKEILAFVGDTEQLNTTHHTIKSKSEVSSLDEPTSQKKLELLLKSKNPLIRLYVWLPIIALIGVIVFLLLKKRQK
ncbi:MAG: hypothetical protein PHD96_01855 [Candidatus Pacebacteria bacterium]|nr:hypothetical protein [Candidatus Paceibacterota bacterium]